MYEYTFEHKHCKTIIKVDADTASKAMKENNLDPRVWILIDRQNNY